MAVSCENIKFFNSQKSFSFLPNAPHIIKLKFYEIKNTVRVPSRMNLTKNPIFLHYFSKFMGILLFVLKYMYNSLLLKMINGFSWPAKIISSPFNKSHYFLTMLVLINGGWNKYWYIVYYFCSFRRRTAVLSLKPELPTNVSTLSPRYGYLHM